MDKDFTFFAVIMTAVITAITLMVIFAPRANNADEIVACMTKSGMVYIDGDCVPEEMFNALFDRFME